MSNFKESVLELLNSRNINTQLFLKKLNLNKNYLYNTAINSTTLPNAVNIANELKVSLDYLCDKTLLCEEYIKIRNANNFFNNFLKILKQSGISQYRFCKDLKYSTNTMARWRNSNLPYLNTVVEIADYLGCSIDDLLI